MKGEPNGKINYVKLVHEVVIVMAGLLTLVWLSFNDMLVASRSLWMRDRNMLPVVVYSPALRKATGERASTDGVKVLMEDGKMYAARTGVHRGVQTLNPKGETGAEEIGVQGGLRRGAEMGADRGAHNSV